MPGNASESRDSATLVLIWDNIRIMWLNMINSWDYNDYNGETSMSGRYCVKLIFWGGL